MADETNSNAANFTEVFEVEVKVDKFEAGLQQLSNAYNNWVKGLGDSADKVIGAGLVAGLKDADGAARDLSKSMVASMNAISDQMDRLEATIQGRVTTALRGAGTTASSIVTDALAGLKDLDSKTSDSLRSMLVKAAEARVKSNQTAPSPKFARDLQMDSEGVENLHAERIAKAAVKANKQMAEILESIRQQILKEDAAAAEEAVALNEKALAEQESARRRYLMVQVKDSQDELATAKRLAEEKAAANVKATTEGLKLEADIRKRTAAEAIAQDREAANLRNQLVAAQRNAANRRPDEVAPQKIAAAQEAALRENERRAKEAATLQQRFNTELSKTAVLEGKLAGASLGADLAAQLKLARNSLKEANDEVERLAKGLHTSASEDGLNAQKEYNTALRNRVTLTKQVASLEEQQAKASRGLWGQISSEIGSAFAQAVKFTVAYRAVNVVLEGFAAALKAPFDALRQGIEYQKELEQQSIDLGAVLAANVVYSKDLGENFRLAQVQGVEAMKALQDKAIQVGVPVEHLSRTFKGLLEARASGLVQNMQQLVDLAGIMQQVVEKDGANGPFTAGNFETSINDLFNGRAKADNPLLKTAQIAVPEWEKMLATAKETGNLLSLLEPKLRPFLDATAKQRLSMGVLLEQFKLLKNRLESSAAAPLFESLKKVLIDVNAWIDSNRTSIESFLRTCGEAVQAVINLGVQLARLGEVTGVFKALGITFKSTADMLTDVASTMANAFDSMATSLIIAGQALLGNFKEAIEEGNAFRDRMQDSASAARKRGEETSGQTVGGLRGLIVAGGKEDQEKDFGGDKRPKGRIKAVEPPTNTNAAEEFEERIAKLSESKSDAQARIAVVTREEEQKREEYIRTAALHKKTLTQIASDVVASHGRELGAMVAADKEQIEKLWQLFKDLGTDGSPVSNANGKEISKRQTTVRRQIDELNASIAEASAKADKARASSASALFGEAKSDHEARLQDLAEQKEDQLKKIELDKAERKITEQEVNDRIKAAEATEKAGQQASTKRFVADVTSISKKLNVPRPEKLIQDANTAQGRRDTQTDTAATAADVTLANEQFQAQLQHERDGIAEQRSIAAEKIRLARETGASLAKIAQDEADANEAAYIAERASMVKELASYKAETEAKKRLADKIAAFDTLRILQRQSETNQITTGGITDTLHDRQDEFRQRGEDLNQKRRMQELGAGPEPTAETRAALNSLDSEYVALNRDMEAYLEGLLAVANAEHAAKTTIDALTTALQQQRKATDGAELQSVRNRIERDLEGVDNPFFRRSITRGDYRDEIAKEQKKFSDAQAALADFNTTHTGTLDKKDTQTQAELQATVNGTQKALGSLNEALELASHELVNIADEILGQGFTRSWEAANGGLEKAKVAAQGAIYAAGSIRAETSIYKQGAQSGGAMGGVGALLAEGPLSDALSKIPIAGAFVKPVGELFQFLGNAFHAGARKIAEQVQKEFEQTNKNLSSGVIGLGVGVQQVQGQMDEAITRLTAKAKQGFGPGMTALNVAAPITSLFRLGGNGAMEELAKLLPPMVEKMQEMLRQQAQIFQEFDNQLRSLNMQSDALSQINSQWQGINEQVAKYLDAGGDQAKATEMLQLGLNQLEREIGGELASGYDQAVQDAIQLNDLAQRRYQMARDERAQEFNLINADSIERMQAGAVTRGQQLQKLRADYQKQMDDINSQISLESKKVAAERQVFDIATSISALHRQDEALQLTALELQLQKYKDLQNAVKSIGSGNATPGKGDPLLVAQLKSVDEQVAALSAKLQVDITRNRQGDSGRDTQSLVALLSQQKALEQKVLASAGGTLAGTGVESVDLSAVENAQAAINAQAEFAAKHPDTDTGGWKKTLAAYLSMLTQLGGSLATQQQSILTGATTIGSIGGHSGSVSQLDFSGLQSILSSGLSIGNTNTITINLSMPPGSDASSIATAVGDTVSAELARQSRQAILS